MRWSIGITLFLVPVVLLGLSGCLKNSEGTPYSIDIEMWGIFDDTDVYNALLADYRKVNPFLAKFSYRKHGVDEYKADLLDAFAADRGPDIFMIHNTWLPEFEDKIAPVPEGFIIESQFRTAFPDVVVENLMRDGRIYGVPLSVDSLALYYNKDLFNYAGITSPPQTWEEFEEISRKLTKLNSFGEITQSGSALGTADNINRSQDILHALMFQKGFLPSQHQTRKGSLSFNNQAQQAFEYYVQFSNPASPLYTWNPRMHYSTDAFSDGTLGMMLNYSWKYDELKRKNARLNFAVAPLPQFASGTPANAANYWVYVVSKNKIDVESPNPKLKNEARVFESWEMLRYMTMVKEGEFSLTNALSGEKKIFTSTIDPAALYAEMTKKPAARRDLIEKQKDDVVLGPFAYGNLIAHSWQWSNAIEVDRLIAEAISSINTGASTVSQAISLLERRIKVYSL